jgi:hypothetical protein
MALLACFAVIDAERFLFAAPLVRAVLLRIPEWLHLPRLQVSLLMSRHCHLLDGLWLAC